MYGKDLNAIAELMECEHAAEQKCRFYAGNLTDPEVQAALTAAANEHRARFLALYEFLVR